MFRDVYRNLLAKRLLLQKSASMEEEKVAITMLKHACGPGFTYRIEGMISDLNLAKDLDNVNPCVLNPFLVIAQLLACQPVVCRCTTTTWLRWDRPLTFTKSTFPC